MRVAYVTPYYNGHCDGRYGRFHDWVHAARDMADPPFEFDVYAFTASNADGTLAGTPHAILGEATDLWGSPLNNVEFLLNAPEIYRRLRTDSYDLLHVQVIDPLIFGTVRAANPDVPVVVGPDIAGWSPVRDVPYWSDGWTDTAKQRARYALKNAIATGGRFDHAIAFSEHHRDILASFSIPPERTTVLEPGVDGVFHPDGAETGESPTERQSGDSPPELLYVGDFSEHKGYPQFLSALAQLDRPVTATLVGAGDPDLERIDELGLSDVVTVEGFVPRADLPAYYRRADLFVAPTIDETAGTNAQIEALACGTPVVVTDKPGVNEFAPEGASVGFAPRTAEALTDALARALDDLDALTAAALAHAGEYTAEHPIRQLDSLYRELIAARR